MGRRDRQELRVRRQLRDAVIHEDERGRSQPMAYAAARPPCEVLQPPGGGAEPHGRRKMLYGPTWPTWWNVGSSGTSKKSLGAPGVGCGDLCTTRTSSWGEKPSAQVSVLTTP